MDTLYPDLYRRILSILDIDDWIHFRYTCKDIYSSVTLIDIQHQMNKQIKRYRVRLNRLLSDIDQCSLTTLCTICDRMCTKRNCRKCTVCKKLVCYGCINRKSMFIFRCCSYEIYSGICKMCVDTFRSFSVCRGTLCPSTKLSWSCNVRQCSNCNRYLCNKCSCFCNETSVYCM